MLYSLITLTAALTTAGLAQPQARPEAPPETPADYAHLLPPREFADVGELLDAIEEADRKIMTVHALIRHFTVNTLADDRQVREGEMFVQTSRGPDGDQPPQRAFVIDFTKFSADGAQRDISRRYVFDGTWLAEIDGDEHVFTKYRIVPPGQRLDATADPSSAPFWIPMDRERERIEKIAHTELLGPTDWLPDEEMPAGLARFAADTNAVQLHLIPREGTGYAERWDDVRIWFDRRTLLPVLYVAVDHSGDQQISQLFDVVTNVRFGAGTFSTETPDANAGWDVQVQDYRGAQR
ncbi:MAG: hypothetical protein DHS20C14_09110 [Phycisphaeraceae bacterium]|nr:MAG: hypothetical protein DHS20C14_09110 [Phycisphaeraceae bacterium]